MLNILFDEPVPPFPPGCEPLNPPQGFLWFMVGYLLMVCCIVLMLPSRWTESLIPTRNRFQ